MKLLPNDSLGRPMHHPAALAGCGAARSQAWLRELALAQGGLRLPLHASPGWRGAAEATEHGGLEPCGIPGGAAATSTPVQAALPAAPGEAADAPPLPRPASTERQPLRVHVDPADGAGVQVWIGLDGGGALPLQGTVPVVAALRRAVLAAHEGVARLVCNGVTVYEAAGALPASTPVKPVPTRDKESAWP